MAIWRQRAQFSLSSLYVCRKDLTAAARFYCTVDAQKNYGSPNLVVNADGTLSVTYMTGTSNANDVFARSGSDLYVTSEEDYTLTEGALCIDADDLPCALTSSVMVYRSLPTKETSFAYNEDGLRVQKTVAVGDEVTVTDYTLHGKLVTGMTVTKTCCGEIVDTQELHFFYDAQSRPTAVNHNGKWYTYIHNLQGDVVAILDSAGVKVVEYKYDAWGKPLGVEGTLKIAELNPFRYRGYVWDEETGLYYLRSRYYDAGIGRFISRDIKIGNVEQHYQHNGFCYARNSCTTIIDVDGYASYNILYDSRPDETEGGKGFPIQAEWWKDRLINEGHEVEMIGFTSIDQFIEKWNRMDACDNLIIIAHGAEGSIDCNGQRLANSKEDGISLPITHLSSELYTKTVKEFTQLYTCHGATRGPSGKSLAGLIANKTGSPVVGAYKAKVNYAPGTGSPYLSGGDSIWKRIIGLIVGRWKVVYPE